MRGLFWGVLLMGLLTVQSAAAALPRPPELEPAVRFWERIYTEVTTSAGLIHDSEDLTRVYEVVRFPENLGWREQQQHVRRIRHRYVEALRHLADDPDAVTSPLERRVRALFSASASPEQLRAAARRVRFQRGQADKFEEGLARSGRWRPFIRRILARHGVPPELAALPHVESSFNPKAVSHAGAAGMWQFTRGTGRRYLRVDHVVDERYDPWRSTEAAAQLLADNFGKLGSWPLAITAYNHGVTGMRRAVRETGTKRIGTIIDGYDGPYFGFASRNFYPALLAAAEIDAHPERFFGPVSLASRARVREVTLPHYIPVAVLERRLGISRAELRRSNPALREAVWDGRKFVPKGYHLRVPAAHTPSLAAGVAAIPLSERYGRQRPDRFHRVRRGQTLSAIAHRYGVRVAKLVAANGLSSRNFIRAGQRLRLPIAGAEPRPLADPAPPKDGGYVVRTGDTLARIARRYGVSMRELAALNGLDDPNLIRPGQRLRLGPEGELAAAEVDPAGGG